VLALLQVLLVAWGLGWTVLASGVVMLARAELRREFRPRRSGRWSADFGSRASALVVLRLAQRGRRHVRRNGCRALVRRRGRGNTRPVVWLRSLGTRVGRGVWCETYWLPEADLVELGDGATVNRGCVVQTHLFHDRVMVLDGVRLEAGATLGPHSVILPAATIGADATVGPASLVLRGEFVPSGGIWSGNPIAPWNPPT
jgi:acetyltransferase-like isoleucine patch superfamily enzyme